MAEEVSATETIIEEAATKPKSVRGDSGEVEHHNPKDLIEVDKYLCNKAQARAGGLGIVNRKISPPGTQG